MNKLTTDERKAVVAALVEGNSLRAVTRMTGVHRTTIMKLLCDLGRACSKYQDKIFRNLKCKRIQCDEIWCFVFAKGKNCSLEQRAKGRGDCWTYVALDSDTKLVPCWYIGQRQVADAYHFMNDLKGRLSDRIQLTTDGHVSYLTGVTHSFGSDVDYAQLQKIYGSPESQGKSDTVQQSAWVLAKR